MMQQWIPDANVLLKRFGFTTMAPVILSLRGLRIIALASCLEGISNNMDKELLKLCNGD